MVFVIYTSFERCEIGENNYFAIIAFCCYDIPPTGFTVFEGTLN